MTEWVNIYTVERGREWCVGMWRDSSLSPARRPFRAEEGLETGGGGGDGGTVETSLCESMLAERNGRSIAERRAASFGFKQAPMLNTAQFRCVSPTLSSPAAIRSPYLTIPPGLSPTALLDSPVLFTNAQVPSSAPTEYLGYGDVNQQNLALLQMQLDFDDQVSFPKQDTKRYMGELPMDIEGSEDTTVEAKCVAEQIHHLIRDQTHHSDEPLNDDTQSQLLLEKEQADVFPTTGVCRPSEDGYNWRKYGQKQVKGSEYPRSYYKCTHPSCQVKKKVERALDGRITEIIYKGSHHHPKPQPTRRSAFGSAYALNEMMSYSAVDPGVGCRAGGLEKTPSSSVVTELSDPLSTAQGKYSSLLADNPELLSTLPSQNDNEDGASQGSMLFGDDGEHDETESKRRKKESCFIEPSSASRAVLEPRVVVQTVSEVDILEDGYRWRKYGQKVVKGNSNPRSYYKCTNPGCSVRKHVERAAHDLRAVITTYEGKHNHDIPTVRNNITSSGNTQPPPGAQTPMTITGSTNTPEPEPLSQDLVPCFENNLEFCSNYLKPSYLGSFSVDSKVFVPPFYEMKLPSLLDHPFVSFDLDASHGEAQQVIPSTNIMQNSPISFSMGISNPSFAVAGYDLTHGRPNIPEFHSITGQQPKVDRMRSFRLLKQEVDTYDSPDSTLSYAQLSPPLSTLSDGQPSNSEQTTGRVLLQ